MDRAIIFVIDIVLKAGYGCPRIILTDNGGEVTNKLIKGIHGRENAVGESSGAGKGWGREGGAGWKRKRGRRRQVRRRRDKQIKELRVEQRRQAREQGLEP